MITREVVYVYLAAWITLVTLGYALGTAKSASIQLSLWHMVNNNV